MVTGLRTNIVVPTRQRRFVSITQQQIEVTGFWMASYRWVQQAESRNEEVDVNIHWKKFRDASITRTL